MLTYSPEKFASLYATDIGQQIWAFLGQPENIARLETASELRKPAVEGLEEQLLAKFRENVLADRVNGENPCCARPRPGRMPEGPVRRLYHGRRSRQRDDGGP